MKIHSITDLITNSSTTIYTYSHHSEQALKDLINEVFKLLGSDKTCDDVFNVVVLCEDSGVYGEAMEQNEEYIPEGIDPEEVDLYEMAEKTYKEVIAGAISKPDWMTNIENNYRIDYYAPGTTLFVVPKSPEYEKLGQLALKFLYSTNHEACYEG